MMQIKLEKSRVNLFLIDGNKDNIAFDCFKNASKEKGGYVISWQTPEMLNERYGITVELASLYPSHAIPKSNAINYLSLDDITYSKLERIGCKCRNSLEAKMPFMFDGFEQLTFKPEDEEPKYGPESLRIFLHELADNAKTSATPIIIPINKQLYKRDLIYVSRYVVEHDISN